MTENVTLTGGLDDEPPPALARRENPPVPVEFTYILDVTKEHVDVNFARPFDPVLSRRVALRVVALCDDDASGWRGLLGNRGTGVDGLDPVGFMVTYDPRTRGIAVTPDHRCTLRLLRFGAAEVARSCAEAASALAPLVKPASDALSADLASIASMLGELLTVVDDGRTVPDPMRTAERLARASARLNGWHSLTTLATPRSRARSDLEADVAKTTFLVRYLKREADQGKAQARGIRATAAALAYLSTRLRAEHDPSAFQEIIVAG